MRRLRASGYKAVYQELRGGKVLAQLRQDPPAAFIIDLSRMPTQGRDLGLWLRQRTATRNVPLVFVAGDSDKVTRVKRVLPDATLTSWNKISEALKRAIARPPTRPLMPASALAGYSGTPLPRKLGIKPDSTVALVGAPRGFKRTLGKLPERVKLTKQPRSACNLVIWFVKSRRELEGNARKWSARLADKGGLWIAWPKKASGVATDLTQNDVRRVGLAAGLVDYKICAIDAIRSGLLFTRRKAT